MMLCALAMYVAAPLIAAGGRTFSVALIGYFVGGLAHFTFAVQVNTLIQLETPDHLRGRAISFYLLAILTGIAVGPLVLGALIDAMGVRAMLLADAAVVATVSSWVVVTGRLRAFDPTLTREAAPPVSA